MHLDPCLWLDCLRRGMWRSLVAHLFWEQRVAGSNPVIPTIAKPFGLNVRAAFFVPMAHCLVLNSVS